MIPLCILVCADVNDCNVNEVCNTVDFNLICECDTEFAPDANGDCQNSNNIFA